MRRDLQTVANGARFDLEGLEGRRMLAAGGTFGGTAGRVWDDAPTIEMSARVAPMAKAAPVILPAVAGKWSGTVKGSTSKATFAASMQISAQKGAAATGTFSLGPATGGRGVTSTAIVTGGNKREFNLIVSQKGLYASVAATVSKNGEQIIGRWSCNGPGGWTTGTITMNLVPAKAGKR